MPEPILLTPTREILEIRILARPVADGQPRDITLTLQRGEVFRDEAGAVRFVAPADPVVASGLGTHPQFAALRELFTELAEQLEAAQAQPNPAPAP